jgi:hypothetical protein
MSELQAVKEGLAAKAPDLCAALFPEGRIRYGKFYVGDLQGNPGRSLVINITGESSGLWKDFATGEGGSNLLELIHRRNGGGDFSAALAEARAWLAGSGPAAGATPGTQGDDRGRAREKNRPVQCRDLSCGTRTDFSHLVALLGIDVHAVEMASSDGTLRFFDHPANGRCWSVLDATFCRADPNLCASGTAHIRKPSLVRQDRRLDGKPFVFQDESVGKGRTVGSAGRPVARFPLRPYVVLCEGSSDFLAAHHLILVESLEDLFSPVALLGAANRIHRECLPEFSGRTVLAFPDYDNAGTAGVTRWEGQLSGIASSFKVFDYAGLRRSDGEPIKDLRDFLRIGEEDWQTDWEVRNPLSCFIAKTSAIKTGKTHHV